MISYAVFLSLLIAVHSVSAQKNRTVVSFGEAQSVLKPYDGPSADSAGGETLKGKVVCGYQGWFSAPGDGSGIDWNHYRLGKKFEPGNCSIDLWPDLSEMDEDEKYATAFKYADGSTAHVFSSLNAKTVKRHFEWMKEYGIDAAFVQRFASQSSPTHRSYDQLRRTNLVLNNCRAAANETGGAYIIMYDLSSVSDEKMERVFADWKHLHRNFKAGRDPKDKAYLHHKGKPLVAIWGIGFKGDDKDRPSLALQEKFIRFLKNNPEYGGYSVMLGIPTGWRDLERDATDDPQLHKVLKLADVLSPWTVGRYRDLEGVKKHAEKYWAKDQQWCEEAKLDYLPVLFPGFSWHNLHRGTEELGSIPRQGGQFFWKQFIEAKRAGARDGLCGHVRRDR